ncbi:gamma-glutamylcyclotransferase family protein [Thermocrinis sp.]|uniref:gamma-glutamylcyclotransferase family protein n=1 Tax=Thermocrinis sp. TaxID=2024383 RepID=UPI002FDC857F
MAYVFVYGTLRNGEVRHGALQNCEFVGLAYAEGYDLYLISDFPGMVPGSGRVVGEVYRVSEDILQRLDWIEGVPSLYRRELIKVKLETGEDLETYTYIYNNSVNGLKKIPSGDWKKFWR